MTTQPAITFGCKQDHSAMPDLNMSGNMSGLEKAKYVLFGKASQNTAKYVWQDREVRFDLPAASLDCRPGETVIDTLVSLCAS